MLQHFLERCFALSLFPSVKSSSEICLCSSQHLLRPVLLLNGYTFGTKALVCLFNLPLAERHCDAPAALSRSQVFSSHLSRSKCFSRRHSPPFPSLLLWRFGSELCNPKRGQNNLKLRVCVTVIQRKQRHPFLIPRSTEAFHAGFAVAMTL